MLDLIDLFPKTIAVTQLETLTSDLIGRAIEYIEVSGGTELGSDGGYTNEQQLLEKIMFREVKHEIISLCLEFSRAYSHEVREIGICNSWGNKVRAGQSIRYHKHSNSYISGSFYLTGGSSLNILNTMYDDLFGIMPKVCKGDDNYRTWESFNVPPKPGRIVLFPSGLHHCVLTSDSQEPRYSIAFNAIPLGRVGIPTSLMNIQLS